MKVYFDTDFLEKFMTPKCRNDIVMSPRTFSDQMTNLKKYGMVKVSHVERIPHKRGTPRIYYIITYFGKTVLCNLKCD